MPGHHCRSACAALLFRCFSGHVPRNLNHLILVSLPSVRGSFRQSRTALLLVCSAVATDFCSRSAANLLLAKQKNRGFPPRPAKFAADFLQVQRDRPDRRGFSPRSTAFLSPLATFFTSP